MGTAGGRGMGWGRGLEGFARLWRQRGVWSVGGKGRRGPVGGTVVWFRTFEDPPTLSLPHSDSCGRAAG